MSQISTIQKRHFLAIFTITHKERFEILLTRVVRYFLSKCCKYDKKQNKKHLSCRFMLFVIRKLLAYYFFAFALQT
jgi:hypothetical protein